MEQYHKKFGVHWLLHRLGICPNAYYSDRKYRKAIIARKAETQALIREIYHETQLCGRIPDDDRLFGM